jgi:predicted RNA binding protein YcfA (HicA-like mRNA interferase family)
MKKIIRLTESDLARIVRRVIKEETEMTKIFEQEKGWLKTDGWKLINTEGKYKLYAEKEDNTTTTVPLKLIITSQSNGTLDLSVYDLDYKLLNSGILKTNNKDEFLKSIKDIIYFPNKK